MPKESRPCRKVKCPCKICMGPVTTKTGIQCNGACQSWMHYECTNYTPGKIRDIKAGLIKIICPCPDCKTRMPREYRTQKMQASCANRDCPANRPPKCDNNQCPINILRGCQDTISQVPSCVWPGTKCGADCKKYPPCADWPGEKCGKVCRKHVCPPNKNLPEQKVSCITPTQSSCSSPSPCPPKSPCGSPKRPSPCPSNVGDCGKVPLNTVEQMCDTVGQLTRQINELMCRMREVSMPRSGSGCFPHPRQASCLRQGPKSRCPKPCYCPDNPNQ